MCIIVCPKCGAVLTDHNANICPNCNEIVFDIKKPIK